MKLKQLLAALLLCVFFTSCQAKKTESFAFSVYEQRQNELNAEKKAEFEKAAAQDTQLTFWSDYPPDILAAEITRRMTNAELLAQMYMFGWAGLEPSPLVIQWVEELSIGSVKVFGWNTDDVHQVAASITLLQQKSQTTRFKIPLYVATDQEGGWIRHVKGLTSDTPGNLAIGAGAYAVDSYYSGFYIARELRALGINMNFAPTVDVYSNINSTVIGPRSFSDDPHEVGILGAAFSAGSLAAGVLSTAKHFPGHGDTDEDSHGRLPRINITREMLFSRELVPYQYLISEKIPAIMSGHLAFPLVTSDNRPASLSRYFLTDVLRGQLGYEGLIITDDMMMNGAAQFAGSLSAAFRLAIEAGNDILCSSTTAQLSEPLWRGNLTLMDSSPEFKAIVTGAALRIIRSKVEYFKSAEAVPLYPDISAIASLVPDPEGKAFFLAQACRSITVREGSQIPLSPETSGKTLLVSSFSQFFDRGRKRYPQAGTFFFKYQLGAGEFADTAAQLRSAAAGYDTVIFFVVSAESARLARTLRSAGKRVIIISGLAPVYALTGFDWAQGLLFVYSYSDYSFEAGFGVLCGDYEPKGVMPLKVEP